MIAFASHLCQPYVDDAPVGGYDSINRLRQYQRGTLSSTGGCGNQGGGSITTAIALPGTDESRLQVRFATHEGVTCVVKAESVRA